MRYETNSLFLLTSKKNYGGQVKIAISSKLIKSAVKRNKIKRLIKEAFRPESENIQVQAPPGIIIGVKKDISSEKFLFFQKEIPALLKKAKLIR